MEYIYISFVAGILTVASPCVLPLLPVVLAGSSTGRSWKAPAIIISSLTVSIVAFTLLLKVNTAFIGVDESFWLKVSGFLIVAVGISLAFPKLWDYFSTKIGFVQKSHELQNKSAEKTGILRNVLLGLSLGPIFTSCSPTYGVILATVLPTSYAVGVFNIVVYALGLAIILIAIAIGGQRAIGKLTWASKSDGWFRRTIGIILVVVGILIATGLIRDLETWWAGTSFNFNDFEINQIRKIKD